MKHANVVRHVLLHLPWYDYRIHRGVARVARERGWQLICPKSHRRVEQIVAGWRGDGCIGLLDDETLAYLQGAGIPAIDLGLSDFGLERTRIVTDNREIGRLAAAHFLDHGYREIIAPAPGGGAMFRERLAALTDFMNAAGGSVHVLQTSGYPWSSVLDEIRSYATARGRRVEESSIGVFMYEDYRAAMFISCCIENGLQVPNNVAVLGVDNDDLINDGLAIGLSTIDSDQEGLGRAGADLLRQMMDHPEQFAAPRMIRHPPKGIVTRQSTDAYAVRSPLVARALHWIHNNFQRGIQAIEVARAMGVTQQGLQSAFAAHFVRSPAEEIRHQRVQAVERNLSYSPANLTEIAERCGYGSVDSLINNFREVHGVTPAQYRKAKSKAS